MLKCYQHLHPLSENVTINQDVDEDYNLKFFEMATRTNKPANELVSREFMTLKSFK